MRSPTRLVRALLWIILGVAVGLANLGADLPRGFAQSAAPLQVSATQTVESLAEIEQDLGSTDGIVLVSVFIVLIVVIPILLRRKAWSNGDKKKTSGRKAK
jgi:Na+/H+ antiporter NhaC